jgi:hypothetical protein
MKRYRLCNAEVDDKYRDIEIYPKLQVNNEYLIHWDGFHAGVIQKWEGKWFTNSVDLLPVVNEIGQYIDIMRALPENE